ncbi:MAG: hypothetical protein O3B76_03180 [Proteobacteria bacterium]|nr:hypothetical protein [Pseudomonadota bacterium]MDA1022551.1 hypothetical protein [Pseudomonadota bacterium]
MTKSPDLEALAKQYLDLWQSQLGGLTEDEQSADIMARTIELMNTGAATFAAMAAAGAGTMNKGNDYAPNFTAPFPWAVPGVPGAQTAAAASGPSDHDLAEFTRRLERLEGRIAALESGAEKSRRSPAKKPRKK